MSRPRQLTPPFRRLPALAAFALIVSSCVVARMQARSLGWEADTLEGELDGVHKLSPLPAGVEELKFSDFYKHPVGPRGLEPTARLLSLAGKRVRLLGFMIRLARPSPGIAMLAPYAMATNENEYGLADDFPPEVIFVTVPRYADIAVPYTPGPLLLTGTLEVGRHEEADTRVSFVRLVLDADAPAPGKATAASTDDNPGAANAATEPTASEGTAGGAPASFSSPSSTPFVSSQSSTAPASKPAAVKSPHDS